MGLLFHQVWVTAHTAKGTTALLQDFIGDCIVGRGIWPPRSPQLRPPEFLPWTFLKKESTAITQEMSRKLNIKLSRLSSAVTKKLFEDLQETG